MIGFLSSLVWNYVAIQRPHNTELRNLKGEGGGVQRLTETQALARMREIVTDRDSLFLLFSLFSFTKIFGNMFSTPVLNLSECLE